MKFPLGIRSNLQIYETCMSGQMQRGLHLVVPDVDIGVPPHEHFAQLPVICCGLLHFFQFYDGLNLFVPWCTIRMNFIKPGHGKRNLAQKTESHVSGHMLSSCLKMQNDIGYSKTRHCHTAVYTGYLLKTPTIFSCRSL